MADSVRELAAELKQFLTAQNEDDLILAAAPTCAAAEVSVAPEVKPSQLPPMQEGSTLTVSFMPAQPKNTLPSTDETMHKQQELAAIAEAIKICTRCPLGSTRLNAVPAKALDTTKTAKAVRSSDARDSYLKK